MYFIELVFKKDVCANRRNANTLAAREKTMQKAVRRDGLAAESLPVNIDLHLSNMLAHE